MQQQIQLGSKVRFTGSLPGTGVHLNNEVAVVKNSSSGGYDVEFSRLIEGSKTWFVNGQQLTELIQEPRKTIAHDSVDTMTKREMMAMHLGSVEKADKLIEDLNSETKPEKKK